MLCMITQPSKPVAMVTNQDGLFEVLLQCRGCQYSEINPMEAGLGPRQLTTRDLYLINKELMAEQKSPPPPPPPPLLSKDSMPWD